MTTPVNRQVLIAVLGEAVAPSERSALVKVAERAR